MKKQEKIDAFKKLKETTKGMLLMGLCGRVEYLCRRCMISRGQADYLYKIIGKENKVTKWIGNKDFCWEPGVKAPRIKWINEQIKKLEGK